MNIYAEIRNGVITWVSRSEIDYIQHNRLGGNAKVYVPENELHELKRAIRARCPGSCPEGGMK